MKEHQLRLATAGMCLTKNQHYKILPWIFFLRLLYRLPDVDEHTHLVPLSPKTPKQ